MDNAMIDGFVEWHTVEAHSPRTTLSSHLQQRVAEIARY